MRVVFNIILVAIGLYATGILFLYSAQEAFIFQPEKLEPDYKFEFASEFEEINLKTLDGAVLNALHFKADSAKGLILYFHGNAGNLKRWGEIVQYQVNLGFDVLVMDYREYGKSNGEWSYENFLTDADLFYQYAMERYNESEIIVYGRSLGTGFASWVTSQHRPRMLILESPYTSIVEMGEYFYPLAPAELLIRYNFSSQEYLKSADCPIHIFHGDSDRIIPFELGERLFKSLEAQTEVQITVVEGGGHNDLIEFKKFKGALEKILDRPY
ncbi:MAG: alpha/beta hydrolase [Bacteroidetes bacterium]|nr:alpha/beta hydrolase [Bacteroidota bacterium]MDA1120518.1 alpha/beta hydrolase [Bacteroidota bacterium]